MKRTSVVTLLLILVLTCPIVIPVRAADAPEKIHVLSYNAENVFDDKVDGSEYAEYGSSSNYYTDRMWQVKLDHIHAVLKEAGTPQIVGLVEIENAHMAQMILESVKDLGYNNMAVTTGDTNTQCVLLSTYPVHFIASLPTTWHVRDILVASVDVKGATVDVLVNHWKAKDSSGNTEVLRIEDAKVARAEVDGLLAKDPSADILLLGDFNSSENEQQITGQPTGINTFLNLTSDRTSMTATPPPSSLYDGWFDVPADQRGSEVYHNQWDDLDHIIMSPGLFDRTGVSYDTGTFGAFRAPFLLSSQRAADGRQIPNRWQVFGTHHSSEGYSDHLPVIAEFTVWPASEPPVTPPVNPPVTPPVNPPTPSPVVMTLTIGSTILNISRDGKTLSRTLEVPPVIISNRSMVPARAIIEALGGSISWNAALRTVAISLGGHSLQLTIGSGIAYRDAVSVLVDEDSKVVPVIQSGRTLLPLRFIAESLGLSVNWEASTGTITLTLQPS